MVPTAPAEVFDPASEWLDPAWQVYEVGGSVRDRLLGQAVHDHDFVVVGASVEGMLARGFKPVGRDFPVFLHPLSHNEYALARTERKTAPGYHGFVVHADPSVTLEQDLLRRDLSINAMARAADGRLIDPFGGQADLARRCLRHVSPAFAEDPVRVLRLARFCARWSEFSVAEDTLELIRGMVAAGELASLVPERVMVEWQRGLMESHPERMLQLLHQTQALFAMWPQWRGADIDQAQRRLAELAAAGFDLAQRQAGVLHQVLGQRSQGLLQAFAAQARLDKHALALAQTLALLAPLDQRSSAEQWLEAFQRADAFRRPQRLEQAAAVLWPRSHPLWQRLLQLREQLAGLDQASIVADHPRPSEALRQARLERAREVLGSDQEPA